VQPQPPNNQPTNTYTVQRGDTLGRIATQFNTTVVAFAQLNGITNPNRIFVGQVLIIPPTGGAISQPNTVIVVVVTATPQPPAPQPPVSGRTYRVTYGDTLYRIAVQFNVTVADLTRVNPNITNRNLIFVGQVINLP
jgi:LysM repeat protein